MGSLISGAIACAIVATFSWLLVRRKKAALRPIEIKPEHRYDLSHERTVIETNGVFEVATTEQGLGKGVVTGIEVAHEATTDPITEVECCRRPQEPAHVVIRHSVGTRGIGHLLDLSRQVIDVVHAG